MKQVVLYGVAGADKCYKVIRYFVIEDELISIAAIKHCAFVMKDRHPEVKQVYAIDNRYGLRRDYMESIKKDSVESCIEFMDILEREGIKII
mgnify:CR=1 FL=1